MPWGFAQRTEEWCHLVATGEYGALPLAQTTVATCQGYHYGSLIQNLSLLFPFPLSFSTMLQLLQLISAENNQIKMLFGAVPSYTLLCCAKQCQIMRSHILENLSLRCVRAFDICCSGILRSCRRQISLFQSPLRTLIFHEHASTRYACPLYLLVRHSSCISNSIVNRFRIPL